jgi:uncharacterized protein YkwD
VIIATFARAAALLAAGVIAPVPSAPSANSTPFGADDARVLVYGANTSTITTHFSSPSIQMAEKILEQIRSQAGRGPLQRHAGLDYYAEQWAQTMAQSGQLTHDRTLAAMANQTLGNRWGLIAENVGMGKDITEIMRAFAESPSHKANLIDSFNLYGIGIAYDMKGRLWIAMRFVRLK